MKSKNDTALQRSSFYLFLPSRFNQAVSSARWRVHLPSRRQMSYNQVPYLTGLFLNTKFYSCTKLYTAISCWKHQFPELGTQHFFRFASRQRQRNNVKRLSRQATTRQILALGSRNNVFRENATATTIFSDNRLATIIFSHNGPATTI